MSTGRSRGATRVAAAGGALLTGLIAAPLYWMVAASVTPESRLFAEPSLFPSELVLSHYRALFDERDFLVPVRNSLVVALLTSFFRQLPRDLEEAAMIDGASRLRAARDVILPIAAPGIASTAILTILYCWNEFLFALSFTLGPDRYTVPVAIALFRGRYQVPWGQVLAAAVISTVPVALIVLAFQRRVVAGLTAGAVKG